MNKIKLINILNLPEEKFSKLKLVFNSDWDYDPVGRPQEIRAKLGDKFRHFDLLNMYGHGESEIVKESVKTHSPNGKKRFINGDYVLCFIPFDYEESWLLVNAYKVLDDNKFLIDVDEKEFSEISSFLGRLVVTWDDRKTRNIVMRDKNTISNLTVKTILEQPYYEVAEKFPGYENINLSWHELRYVLKLRTWKTALENQKGVYLITDAKTNKRYVGSAYGNNMILGRWSDYAKDGHGGNKELRKLVSEQGIDYVKDNFRYSILDIYKSTVDDETIITRESWWKELLLTRNPDFGYNAN